MKRLYSRLGMAVAALALAGGPALAGQRPSQDSGSTPAADRAVERGSAGGGSAGSHSGGGGGSVAGGGSVESTSSAPSAGAAAPSFGAADRHVPMYAEPQRRGGGGNSGSGASGGESRRGGGGGDRAVPRGSGSSGSSGTSKSGNDATTSSSSSSGNRREAPTRDNGQEVPSWSRPRGDRPAVDTAAERSGRIPDRNSRGGFYGRSYDPFYPSFYGSSPYSYYSGFGLGYGYGFGWPLFYDPWYDPYGGVGYGGGYGGGGYYRGTQYASIDQGRVRLKVKPRNAKVYVDGYFVGDVDQFDGAFQKLSLNGGRHHVEIKADGYETAEFDVMIMPDQTITYAGELKRIQ